MVGMTALKYFRSGCSCSQCILKACADVYGLKPEASCYNMLGAISNGLGIGSTCSVLTAGIMVLGLIFGENAAKRLRLKFMSEASKIYGSLSCPALGRLMSDKGGCGKLIMEIGDILENIINDAQGR